MSALFIGLLSRNLLGGPAIPSLEDPLVRFLGACLVQTVCSFGAVRLAPGLQYFQQRLGFEIFNVRPVPVADDALTPR